MAVTDCEPMHAGDDGWSEWVHPLPGYLMQCCDCGLIHRIEFMIVPRSMVNGDGELNPGESDDGVILFRAAREQSE